MSRQRRSFTREMKRQIVESVMQGKKSIEDIEKEFKITRHQFYRWKEKHIANAVEYGAMPMSNGTNGTHNHHVSRNGAASEMELLQLKVRLAELMLENERLKSGSVGGRTSTTQPRSRGSHKDIRK